LDNVENKKERRIREQPWAAAAVPKVVKALGNENGKP